MLDIIKISKSMEHNKCIHAKEKLNRLSNLSHGLIYWRVTSMTGMNPKMGNW
jgi:hypothetical protein